MRKEKMAQSGRKCIPVAEIPAPYRKSGTGLMNPMALSYRPNCSRNLRNSCFCACAVKMWLNYPKRCQITKISIPLYMSLRTTVITDFGPEA